MPGRAFVGTSGWSYTSWRPKFYPEGTKSAQFLRYYATRLARSRSTTPSTTCPRRRTWRSGRPRHPRASSSALKASQQITHRKQLREPAETLPIFFERARLLGERLGPILFQTPPWVKRDDDRLAMFLAALPRDVRCALEVRDPSWYAPEVYDLLRTANVPLVHAEGEKAPSPVETLGETADFAYTRLRARDGYTRKAVDAWAARLRAMLDCGQGRVRVLPARRGRLERPLRGASATRDLIAAAAIGGGLVFIVSAQVAQRRALSRRGATVADRRRPRCASLRTSSGCPTSSSRSGRDPS